jgi:hypothetical protein
MQILKKLGDACEKILELIYRNPFLCLSILYFLGYSALLINDGIFWDDWHVNFLSNQEAFDMYNSVARPFHGILFVGLRALTSSHYLIGFLVYASFWIAGLFFYGILRKLKIFSRADAFWVAALFMVFPQCFSRICETILFFAIYLCLFMTASYFYLFRNHRKSLAAQIAIMAAFFISFDLEALQLFFLVPLFLRYCIGSSGPFSFSFKKIISFCKENWTFVILPPLYLFFALHVPTHLPREQENAISLPHLMGVPGLLQSSWQEGFVHAAWGLFKGLSTPILLLIILLSLLAPDLKFLNLRKNLLALAVSIFLFGLAMLPYTLVGKDIGYYYIMDRNSIVALIPLALISFYFVSLAFSFTRLQWVKALFLVFILLIFVQRNFAVYRSFLIASVKQDALIYQMSTLPEFKEATTFLIKDQTWEYLAKDTPLESSVLRGLLRSVFHSTDKCAAHIARECAEVSALEKRSLLHNVQSYQPTEDQYIVEIGYGPLSIRGNAVFARIFRKLFDRQVYDQQLKDVLEVKMQPILRP